MTNAPKQSRREFEKLEVQTLNTSLVYPTIKSALAAGFREKRPQDYGGEEIVLKSHTLIRNAVEAESMTEWGQKGFRPIKGVEPHARVRIHQYRRGYLEFDVYRNDQVEAKRQSSPATTIPVLAALWVVNRRAKRCRDLAINYNDQKAYGFAKSNTREKKRIYGLKGQVLQYLLNEDAAVIIGHHRFPNGNWAELVSCEGYTLHRPCAPLEGVVPEERKKTALRHSC